MNLAPQSKTIAGVVLETTIMPPTTNYPLGLRMMKILLPVLQQFGGIGPKELAAMAAMVADDLGKVNVVDAVRVFGPMLEVIVAELAKPENARLPSELLAGTVAYLDETDAATGMPSKLRVVLSDGPGINRTFHGNMFGLIAAMVWAAQVNFADFFRGASALGPIKARKSGEKPSG